MTTKISTDNIQPNTVVSYAEYAGSLTPRISSVFIANSSYVILDDTAANTGGGYIVISGANFVSGAQVIIDTTVATSVSFVNSTTLRAQIPAKAAATYNVYVINPDGGTGIAVNGLTYSATPGWVTTSPLTTQSVNTAFSIAFDATSATTYQVANGSSLPAGTTLLANGWFYGSVSVGSDTTYNFSVDAIDAQNQESTKAFSLTISLDSQWIRTLAGSSGDNHAKMLTIDTSDNIYVGVDSATYGSSANNLLFVSYDKQGTRRWEKYYTDIASSNDFVTGLTANNNQGLVIYNGHYSSSGYMRGMIGAFYGANGNVAWSRTFISSSDYNDFGGGITSNNSYLWATFYTNVNYLFGNYDAVLTHLNVSDGSKIGSITTGSYWQSGAGGFDAIYDIRNYGDSIYTAGMRNGNLAYFGKYSKTNDGSLPISTTNWAETFYSGYVAEEGRKIAIDSSENVYALANTAETIGTFHFVVSKYNSSGSNQWRKTLRAASYPTGICVDAINNIYIQYSDETSNNCVGIMKIDASGNIVWQKRIIRSGINIRGRGLESRGNVIVGLAQVDTTPKSVMLFKIKTDGTGTGTYNNYTYESTGYSLVTPSFSGTGSPGNAFASYGDKGATASLTNQNTSPQLTETVIV